MIQNLAQNTAVCGDNSCDVNLGESYENCPQDCLAGVEYDPAPIETKKEIPVDPRDTTAPMLQTNPWIAVSGILMMLTLIVPLLYWRIKTSARWRFFAWGALLWTTNIILKAILDFTLYPKISLLVGVFIYALLLGIRTGVFECVMPYLFIRIKKNLKEASWIQAVAFGIGFGGFENFIVGLQSSLSSLVFTLRPALLRILPGNIQIEYLKVLTAPTWFIFAPFLERTSALFIHIAACVLIFLAIKTKKLRYLWYAFGLKSLLDASVLCLAKVENLPLPFVINAYLIEIPIAILGVISLLWIFNIRKKYLKINKNHNI